MFPTSSQKKHWMFPDEDSIKQRKIQVHAEYCSLHGQGMSTEQRNEHFLSLEESEIMVRSFEKKLIEFCVGFEPPMPKGVQVLAQQDQFQELNVKYFHFFPSGHRLSVFQTFLPEQHRNGLPSQGDPGDRHLLSL